MPATLVREFTFEAAHHLPWHPGKCARPHGHSYRLEVAVDGHLDHRGVVMDFADLKEVVARAVLDRVDHHDLNDVLDNPTAERVVLAIGGWLDDAGLTWSALRLWETAECSVRLAR